MHDPWTVVFSILRPWPLGHGGKRWSEQKRPRHPKEYRHRQWGPLNLRARRFKCAHCDDGKVRDPVPSYQERQVYGPGDDCPDCGGVGFTRTSWRHRLYFSWNFWLFGTRRYYLPPVVTVWHVDPDKGGDDDSCRRKVRTRQLECYRDGDKLGDWFWWKVFCHMHWFHVHHWRLQVIPLQRLQRHRKVRCAHCGERFGWSESSLAPGYYSERVYHFRCAEKHGMGVAVPDPSMKAGS